MAYAQSSSSISSGRHKPVHHGNFITDFEETCVSLYNHDLEKQKTQTSIYSTVSW